MSITASGNITTTIYHRYWITGAKEVDCKMAYTSGSDRAYPAGGIPLPAIGKFGFSRALRSCVLVDAGSMAIGSKYLWKYSVTGQKLLAFKCATAVGGVMRAVTAGTAIVGPIDFRALVRGV